MASKGLIEYPRIVLYDVRRSAAAPVSLISLRSSPDTLMQGLLTAGEINARKDQYFRPRQVLKEETQEAYEARLAKGKAEFPPPPTISPGSDVQVSYDGSDRFHPGRVVRITGDSIACKITLPSGQEIERVNIRHESDPMAKSVEYQALYTSAVPEGGVWKYSDNETDLRRQIETMQGQLKQLLAVKGETINPPADQPKPLPKPEMKTGKSAVEALHAMAKE